MDSAVAAPPSNSPSESTITGGGGPQPLIPFVEPLSLEERLGKVVGELTWDDVVEKSKLAHSDPIKQRDAVVNEFNRFMKEHVIVGAGARQGERVDPGYFYVAHKNKNCEMRAGTGERLVPQMVTGYTDVGTVGPKENNGKFKQNDPLIGDYGTFVVNVPQGKVAKVWVDKDPHLLGEGPHVFHDPLFKASPRPDQLFAAEGDSEISHGSIHIIRVPTAFIALVTVDTQNFFLPYRRKPYVFNTNLFTFHKFMRENTAYIDHSPLHLVRVPAGTVAKIRIGSRAAFLEYREEPYFFDDPLFQLEETMGQKFLDANLKHIRHGTLNRLRPGVDGDLERAVVQHDGEIRFVDRFTTLDSAHSAVLGFINMGIQTCVFPSKETRNERRRENPSASQEEIQYEPMTTKDSLKIGMKLLVAFQVEDPHLMMSKLRLQDVSPHVENLAVSDMVRAVQHSTSQNFVNAASKSAAEYDEDSPSDHIADRVREELRKHLKDCGLNLVRFSIEEAKVLDPEISREMSKQSLVAATANAQQAVIEQKAAIAKAQAEVDAMSRKVQQDQENKIRIEGARAELEAARLKAEATVVTAEAEQKAQELLGTQYQKFPELLQVKLAELQYAALAKSNLNIISPELKGSPFVLGAGYPTVPMTGGSGGGKSKDEK